MTLKMSLLRKALPLWDCGWQYISLRELEVGQCLRNLVLIHSAARLSFELSQEGRWITSVSEVQQSMKKVSGLVFDDACMISRSTLEEGKWTRFIRVRLPSGVICANQRFGSDSGANPNVPNGHTTVVTATRRESAIAQKEKQNRTQLVPYSE